MKAAATANCGVECIKQLLPNLAAAGFGPAAVKAAAALGVATGEVAAPVLAGLLCVAAFIGLTDRSSKKAARDQKHLQAAIELIRKRTKDAESGVEQLRADLAVMGFDLSQDMAGVRERLEQIESLAALNGQSDQAILDFLKRNEGLTVSLGRFLEQNFDELRAAGVRLEGTVQDIRGFVVSIRSEIAGLRQDFTAFVEQNADNPDRTWTLLTSYNSAALPLYNVYKQRLEDRCQRYAIPEEQRAEIIHRALESEQIDAMARYVRETQDQYAASEFFHHAVSRISKMKSAEESVTVHAAKILVATIAAQGYLIPWWTTTFINNLSKQPFGDLKLGDHWLIAIAALAGPDTLRQQILDRFDPGDPNAAGGQTDQEKRRAEHAMMNLLEGMRAYVVALSATSSPPDGVNVPSALDKCLQLINFNYAAGRSGSKESELRLSFNVIALTTCAVASLRLQWHQQADAFMTLAGSAIDLIVSDDLREVSNGVVNLITEGRIGLEFLPRKLKPGGEFEQLASNDPDAYEALFRLFYLVVHHRTEYSGPGWSSWRGHLGTYGRLSTVEAMRNLSNEAMNIRPSAMS